MNNFDKAFAEAVKILLEQKDDKRNPETSTQKSATQMIQWNPGKGNWGQIIKGLKEDAEVGYEAAVARSAATAGKSKALMARLQITKPSSSDNPAEAAAQILYQALQSPTMAAVFDTPSGSKTAVNVPIKLSTKEEDISSGEGISGRNAAAFIHLTLLGAYNAGMLKIKTPIRLGSVKRNDSNIPISG